MSTKKKTRKAPNHRIRSKKANHRIRSKKAPKKVFHGAGSLANHMIKSMGITSKEDAILALANTNHRISLKINAEYEKALAATHHAAKMNQNDPGTSSIRNLYTREWFDSLSRLKKLLENSD